jgi:hypothetical protein
MLQQEDWCIIGWIPFSTVIGNCDWNSSAAWFTISVSFLFHLTFILVHFGSLYINFLVNFHYTFFIFHCHLLFSKTFPIFFGIELNIFCIIKKREKSAINQSLLSVSKIRKQEICQRTLVCCNSQLTKTVCNLNKFEAFKI